MAFVATFALVSLVIILLTWYRNNRIPSQSNVILKLGYPCPDLSRPAAEPAAADPVPNVVNFILLDSDELDFVGFICILAAFFNHGPDVIRLRTNRRLKDNDYLTRIKARIGPAKFRVMTNPAAKPTHVFGQPLAGPFHAADVLRLKLAAEEGGIFLDLDTFVVRNLTELRRHEVVLGRQKGEYLGTQFLMCRPKATFIRLWLTSYKDYRPSMWYYNAGEKPTTQILDKCPKLVHVEERDIGVSTKLSMKLYEDPYWSGWKNMFAIHLLTRHRSYLTPNDVKSSGIHEFNEKNIIGYKKPFGELARSVLNRL